LIFVPEVEAVLLAGGLASFAVIGPKGSGREIGLPKASLISRAVAMRSAKMVFSRRD
jgi:hypothetical protein